MSKESEKIEAAVDALMTEHGVSMGAVYAGQHKEGDWDYDLWQINFVIEGTYAAPLKRREFKEVYRTGLGLRKSKNPMPKAYRGDRFATQQWEKLHLKPVKPHPAGALWAYILDAEAGSESFLDWCDNQGFDNDSITAFNIYNACCKTSRALDEAFGRELLKKFADALQDY